MSMASSTTKQHLPLVCNVFPHYISATFDTQSTVRELLMQVFEAHRMKSRFTMDHPVFPLESFQLRWIVDPVSTSYISNECSATAMPISQDEAFKLPPWTDDTTKVKMLHNEARLWYETKGHSLTTRLLAEYTGDNPFLNDVIPSKPDDNLIRLYVVSIGTQRWLPKIGRAHV